LVYTDQPLFPFAGAGDHLADLLGLLFDSQFTDSVPWNDVLEDGELR
jgi:hypothetical protein